MAFDDLLYFAQRAEAISGVFPTRILDEAIRTIIKGPAYIPDFNIWSIQMRIIRYGLSSYLESQLPKLNLEATPPPLLIALTSLNILTTRDIELRYDPALSPSSVQLLLHHGASPNEMVKHDTIWELFVKHEYARAKKGIQGTDACFEVVMLLLNAGAKRYHGLTDHLRIIFKPSHARQLEEHIQYLASRPYSTISSQPSVPASLDNQSAMSGTQSSIEPQIELGQKGKDSTKILQTSHPNGDSSASTSRTGHNDLSTIGIVALPQPGIEPQRPKPRRLRLILSCFRP
ncbi:hypothetical protein NPX13_g9887 [Xylaria arbuscula]|uniref:Uncharacterized protein n=1 Tax=Xylaria arbuscula TaxID=114810 RepID=A0A9W8TIF8_9PEZI|nr:hypothetical protein NPX13_g9887 [Xylaria arbuscula]